MNLLEYDWDLIDEIVGNSPVATYEITHAVIALCLLANTGHSIDQIIDAAIENSPHRDRIREELQVWMERYRRAEVLYNIHDKWSGE